MPSFPLPLGLGSFGGEDPETYYRLFKALQGEGGYSDDDESNRCRELKAWATIAAIVAGAIKRASEQTWPTVATELLDEWEQRFKLANNASRTALERQQRLKACAALRMKPADIAAAMAIAGTATAQLYQNIDVHVLKDDVEPDAIFQRAVEIDSESFDDPPALHSAIDAYHFGMPARMAFDMDSRDRGDAIVETVGARWNTDKLDRSAIGQQVVNQRDHIRHPSRLKSYGPLSKLKAADFNAIQDALLWGVASDSDVMSSALAGGEWVAFAEYCASAAYTILDNWNDWRDRLIIVALRLSTDNILPGGANDDDFNSASTKVVLMYSGSGGTGYDLALITNVTLEVTSDTGVLRVYNASGSNYYICGMVVKTEDLGER